MRNEDNKMGKLIKGVNDLQTLFPELAKQWHPTLNGDLTPDCISAHRNGKVFWMCEKGHAYDVSPDKRTHGEGCPYCNNRRLLIGYNDLVTNYPNLAAEWDYEKNPDRPEDYTYRSMHVAHWKCKTCGCEWTARIRDRADSKYQLCPKCTLKKRGEAKHQQVLASKGGITNPHFIAEWDYEKNIKGPEEYTPSSNDSVYWICSICGYHYKAKISNRAHGRNCPCCSNKVVVKGVNGLATTHPEIAKEWYQPENGSLTPSDVTYGSGKKVKWLCPKGHVYPATILHRINGGTNCPICNSGRHTSFAEQAVYYYVKKVFPNATNHYKEIFTNGMELDIYIPDIKLGIEYDGVYWHKKAITYEREKRKYDTCRKNGIKLLRIREGKEDNKYPAADYSIFMPDGESDTNALNHVIQLILAKIDPQSNPWTRKNPYHFWSDVDVNIDRDKYEILAYLNVPVENSVFDVAPELIAEWDYERNGELKPEMIKAGSSISVNWICSKCGYRWIAQIGHRAINHTGCPKCAGFVFEKGVNDLATKSPELLKEWDYDTNSAEGLDPTEIQYNSSREAHWICSKCGHKWIVGIRFRSVEGRGCIKCGYENAKKHKNEKNLEVKGCITDPLLLKEWDYEENSAIGLDPKLLPPGSNKPAYWICSTCGYKWIAPIARRSNGAGCRKCADKANPELLTQHRIKSGHGLTDPCLLKEWDYKKNEKMPSEYSYGSGKKVFWICSTCGYSWQATINSRHKGAGCPACAGNIVVPGKNDLLTMRPSIATEWDYFRNGKIVPESVSYSSGKKYWWICPEGHDSYLASPGHRILGTGCPICGNQKISLKQSRTVEQFSLEGKYIKTYPSLKIASQECGVSSSAICNAIKRGTVSAGFKWKYSE